MKLLKKMIIEEKNNRGNSVGFWDTSKLTYNTSRDAKKGQIYFHFGNAMAIDLRILKRTNKIFEQLLNKFKVEDLWKMVKVLITVKNYEKEEFIAQVSIFDFMNKGEKTNYDKRKDGINYSGYGEQVRLPMKEFVRIYKNQGVLSK